MAIVLGGNGVDVAINIGPNIVTNGLVFYTDTAIRSALIAKNNATVQDNSEIDFMYGLLEDNQQVSFSSTTALPAYSSANQGYLSIGFSTNDTFVGTLSKQVLLGGSYTLDVWIAPRVLSSYVGTDWLTGRDLGSTNPTYPRVLLAVSDSALATYGYNTLRTSITQGQWINVVVVTNLTEATYYVNGTPRGSGDRNSTGTPNTALRGIGNSTYSTGGGADGYMGPIKAYNVELTAQEVLQNYNAMRSRYSA